MHICFYYCTCFVFWKNTQQEFRLAQEEIENAFVNKILFFADCELRTVNYLFVQRNLHKHIVTRK